MVLKKKITSKFKARFFLRQTRVSSIKDSSVTLLHVSKTMQIQNHYKVEELINPKYTETGHQNKTKEILCLEVEKP